MTDDAQTQNAKLRKALTGQKVQVEGIAGVPHSPPLTATGAQEVIDAIEAAGFTITQK
jgi:hypothetical protein